MPSDIGKYTQAEAETLARQNDRLYGDLVEMAKASYEVAVKLEEARTERDAYKTALQMAIDDPLHIPQMPKLKKESRP